VLTAAAGGRQAKAGVVGLTKTVAREWGGFNIRCNAVTYGYIATRLTSDKDAGASISVDGQKARAVWLGGRPALRVLQCVKRRGCGLPVGRPNSPHLRIAMCLARHEFVAACVAQDCSGRSSGLISTCIARQFIAAAVHLGQLHPVRLRALQRLKRLRCLRRSRRTGWSWPNGTAAALSCVW